VKEAEVIFLALHGGQGEDGTVQAVLDVIGIPYTGSGPLASALAMDKEPLEEALRRGRCAGGLLAHGPRAPVEGRSEGGVPLRGEAVEAGSTVGLTVVKAKKDLAPAIELAYQFDDEVMIEAFIAGRELTSGCSTASPSRSRDHPEARDLRLRVQVPAGDVGGDLPRQGGGWIATEAPAPLGAGAPGAQARQLLADRFPAEPMNELICLEANTLPGMTATSLLPQSGAAVGIPFPELWRTGSARGRGVGG